MDSVTGSTLIGRAGDPGCDPLAERWARIDRELRVFIAVLIVTDALWVGLQPTVSGDC
jgi:hypothetical protein